jgi:hypothetical protein
VNASAISWLVVCACAAEPRTTSPPKVFDGLTPERVALAFTRCPDAHWIGFGSRTVVCTRRDVWVTFQDRAPDRIQIGGETLGDVRQLFDELIAPMLRAEDAEELRDSLTRPLRPEPPVDLDEQRPFLVVLGAEANVGIVRDDLVRMELSHRSVDPAKPNVETDLTRYAVFARRDRGYVGAVDVGVLAHVEWHAYPAPSRELSR